MTELFRCLGHLRGACLTVLLLAACADDGGAPAEKEASLPPGIEEPVASPERPQTLGEALAGESQVAIWQLRDEDSVVYLLGTVHLMRPGTDWQTPAIRKAFARADAVYLEADVFSREAQRAMGVVVTRAAQLNDRRLSSFYDKKELERFNEGLAEIGMSLSAIDEYRPWFAAVQISGLALIEAGGDPAAGADVMIARQMLERDVPMRYLETASEQIAMLAAGKDDDDADYLLELVDSLEEGEAYYADLMHAWYKGDVERLDFLINGAFADQPDLKERLLVERNMRWAQQIDRLMTEESGYYLVAVGAGHLVGETSLIAQLESRGYVAERVLE